MLRYRHEIFKWHLWSTSLLDRKSEENLQTSNESMKTKENKNDSKN